MLLAHNPDMTISSQWYATSFTSVIYLLRHLQHVNSTLFIHGTGNFLSWHRYFLWSFEQALRNECGYNGYQPYLNYGKIASNPLGAPVFDGSSTSISGNGGYKAYAGVKIPSAAVPLISLPPGQGGDCVTSGPFASMSVNLGPLSPVFTDVPANPQPDGLGYNPRCLRRDISQFASSTATTDQNVTDLISQNTNIADFQNTLQGNFGAGEIGIHTAAHYIVGGDAGGDIFTSPGDPFFWLHHAMIDRIWWIWQNQDPLNRMNVIAGTITLLNNPPSRDATLNDIIDLGVVAASGTIPISSAVYTLGGPFCYIYM